MDGGRWIFFFLRGDGGVPKWLLSSDKSQKPLSLLLVTFDSSWLSNLGGDGQLGELRGGEKEVKKEKK